MNLFIHSVVYTAIQAVWSGIVLKTLWAWFIVPLFGLPLLTVPLAIGLSLVVSFITNQYGPTEDEDLPKMMASGLTSPLVVLVIGWVVHLFV